MTYFIDRFNQIVRESDKATIPPDPENRNYQEYLEWKAEGNEPTQEEFEVQEPTYNWQGLAIAFKLSLLNQILTQLKDESTNPQISAIWRISDELVQVITIPVFGESDRVASLTQEMQSLFQKLEQGKVSVPDSARTEILQALQENGFEQAAKTLSRNSVT